MADSTLSTINTGITNPTALIPTDNPGAQAGATIVDIAKFIPLLGPEAVPLAIIVAGIGIVIELVSDLVDAIVSLFGGRAREDATLAVAKRLMSARNPAARLYGIELTRMLHDDDIVISSGDPGQEALLGQAFHQFVTNLTAQGVPKKRAQNIALDALSRDAQAGKPLEPELQKPLDPGLTMLGSPAIVTAYQEGIQQGTIKGLSGDKLNLYAQKFTIRHVPLRQLLTAQIGKPPPPPTTPGDGSIPPIAPQGGDTWKSLDRPIQNPNCQSSYKLDPNTNTYTPTPYCGVVPAGFTYDPVNDVATPDPNNFDEIQSAQRDLAYGLSNIAYQLKQLVPPPLDNQTAPPDANPQSDCCDRIVTAIASITEKLAGISTVTPINAPADSTNPEAAGAVPNLEPIATTLNRIADALDHYLSPATKPGTDHPDDTPQTLERIAAALEKSATADASQDEKQDVPQPLIDKLFADRVLPDELRAIISGAPPAHVDPAVKGYERDSTLLRWYNETGYIWNNILKALGLPFDPDYASGKGKRDYNMKPILDAGEKAAEAVFSTAFDVTGSIFKPVTDALLKVHADTIAKLRDLDPGDETDAASQLLDEAIGAGVGAHLSAVIAEFTVPGHQVGFPQMAALMAELAGFKEIMAGIIGPEVEQAISVPHRYKINATARAVLPGLMQAAEMLARGIISRSQYDALAGFNGLNRGYVDQVAKAAARGINPRQMLRALDLGILTDADIQDELQFSGLRPESIERMKRIAHALALVPYEQKALAQLTTAYEHGLLTDQAFSDHLADFTLPDGAERFIFLEAQYKKLTQLSELYRKSVSEAYRYNQITDADYIPRLEAIGIADADAEAHYAIDSIVKRGLTMKQEEREAMARQRELNRKKIFDARAEYLAGRMNAAEAALALASADEPPGLIAAELALLATRAAGSLVRLYGLSLNRNDAALLKAQVSAIQEQTLKKLISAAAARAQLESLKIPPRFAEALASKWDAEANKTIIAP